MGMMGTESQVQFQLSQIQLLTLPLQLQTNQLIPPAGTKAGPCQGEVVCVPAQTGIAACQSGLRLVEELLGTVTHRV